MLFAFINSNAQSVESLDIEGTINFITSKLKSSQAPDPDDEFSSCDKKYMNELGASRLSQVPNTSWNVRLVGKKLFLAGDTYFDIEVASSICYSCLGSEETIYSPAFETYNDGTIHKLILKIKFPDKQTADDFCFAIGNLRTLIKKE